MAIHKWSDVRKRQLTPAQLAEVDRLVAQDLVELNLRELRETLGKTQVEMAAAVDMSQSELSRSERREDHLLSTLRRYVEALGGELEVVANFGDRRVRLKGV